MLGSPFDVCHVGVVLRVVLGVQAVVALAVSVQAASAGDAFNRWSQVAVVTLSASLFWLVVACAGKRWVNTLSDWTQTCVALALGAIAGGLAQYGGALLNEYLIGERALTGWPQVSAMMTGAALSALALGWLRHRARSVVPAHATARLAELQARIRPHFLFNTLNTAIALVQIDPQRAERVLEDLAELFRQALQSPSTMSTLRDEVSLAKRYLDIEALRFGERMKVRWDVDEAAGGAKVPALVLQPLVENAVHHGIEVDPQGGWIVVRAVVQGGQVVLTVSNSVPLQLPLQGREGHGMALRNVRQRLKLMHDVVADFDARLQQSTDGRQPPVYVVRMVLPLPSETSA
ncbi:MAG: sensor histidine kinase [Aquabacterium sp.]|uniref:sensor histidine kinase n=1 Tax=Aquabacterium sp. TaxID=1872578 RepID=UPI003BCC4CB7